MNTNNTKKAAGASNSTGPHTDTNGANFPTDGTQSSALRPPLLLTPDMAAILTKLRKLSTDHHLRVYEILELDRRDFVVYTDTTVHFCSDMDAVEVSLPWFGVNK
jgi:hypothetical protein